MNTGPRFTLHLICRPDAEDETVGDASLDEMIEMIGRLQKAGFWYDYGIETAPDCQISHYKNRAGATRALVVVYNEPQDVRA